MAAQCPACGAGLADDERCSDLFDRLLALEWRIISELDEDKAFEGKRAHFLAVGTYQLQHPDRLAASVLRGLLSNIGAVLDRTKSVDDVRIDARRRFNGPQRVRRRGIEERDPELGAWPDRWRITVGDCCDVAASEYFAAVERWAEATTAAVALLRSREAL